MKSTTIFLIALLFLCLLYAFVTASEPTFIAKPAEDWTALLDRTEGWIAGDGIYSYGMDGDSRQGSANEQSKTIFTVSDSLIGSVNPDGTYGPGLVMTNHAVGVFVGNKPEPANIQFFHNTNADGRPTNLFDRNYWINDGIVIDSVMHTTGVVVNPHTWEMDPEGPWMITVPIRDEQLQFSETRTKPVALFNQQGAYTVLFGIAITDQGDDIYVYGVRDRQGTAFYRRQLVVSKAPRQSFSDISTWRFWTGEHWSESIADANRDEAVLAEGIANEISVTHMVGGRYDGKFVLVSTEGSLGPNLAYSVADKPNARFSEPTVFFVCPQPKLYAEEMKRKYGPDAFTVTYNAKAHPRLSQPGELLISYNLNAWGLREGIIFADKKYYSPRFVLLKLP